MSGNCQDVDFPVCPRCRCNLAASADSDIWEGGSVIRCEECGFPSMVYAKLSGRYSSFCLLAHSWHMLNGCKVCSLCGVEDEGGL